MHALVTGAGGFLGRYLAEQLVARGDRVRVLTRVKKPELDRLGVEYRLGVVQSREDVLNACRGPQPLDCVFHAAAKAGIWGKWPSTSTSTCRGPSTSSTLAASFSSRG